MSLISEIKSIEKESERDKNWLYHGFTYNHDDFNSMIKKGLKSAFLKPSLEFGYNNGPFYISLAKEIGPNEFESAFWFFTRNFFTFILKDIRAFPCLIPGDLGNFLAITPLPLRKKAGWSDEWQAFGLISPKKYVGIQCSLIQAIEENPQTPKIKELKDLIEQTKNLGLEYPIYDYSRLEEEKKVYTIDTDKYLSLTRKMHR